MAIRRWLTATSAQRCVPLALAFAALTASTPALADSQSSPELLKIRALDLRAASGVLRIAVQRLTVPDMVPPAPAFSFNPAGCTQTTASYALFGTNTSLLIFDLSLGARGRSRTTQQQMLSAVYAAFASDRLVRISVRDDLCTPTTNTPYVSGVEVE